MLENISMLTERNEILRISGMDSSLLPTCDVCNQYIVKGTTLHHCTACGQDPGFDVCGKCYEPNVHGIHKDYINCGIFPQFNPYGKY